MKLSQGKKVVFAAAAPVASVYLFGLFSAKLFMTAGLDPLTASVLGASISFTIGLGIGYWIGGRPDK